MLNFILMIHVVFGTVAVCCGGIAMISKKGNRPHRLAGKTYVVTMLIMAASGLTAALYHNQMINVIAALLTSYLVITAWHAAKYKSIEQDKWVRLPFVCIVLVGVGGCSMGVLALYSANQAYAGFTHIAYFFIGGVALFAALLDAYILVKGRLTQKQRMIRHIWRMSFSYFIAAGSLFTGPGATSFPESIQNSGILAIPEPLILIAMLYFIAKTALATKKTKPVEQ